MKTGDFLDAIYSDSRGLVTVVTRGVTGELTDQQFFEYPQQKDAMVALATQKASDDVYYSPILFNAPRRIKENAKTVHVIYSDADTCAPENFFIEPSISVQTSPNRWHCYWMLDKEVDPQVAALLAKKIAYAHSHQGCDKSGWNTTKLLRIPNSMNRKEGVNYAITATTTGVVYSIDELNQAYGDVQVEPIRELSLEPMPAGFPDLIKTMGKIQSNPEIVGLYMNQPDANADMSKLLWKLEIALFKQGLTAEEVFVIARGAKCNKYHSPNRPKRSDADGDLWREVQRAAVSHQSGEVAQVIDLSDIEPDIQLTKPVFLSDSERKVVLTNPTFIDQYKNWATSKTDGAIQYQIASAFTLLSCVFSDIGYAVPKFGKMGLNLWFMVLGETTLTRKSTSRNLMVRAVLQKDLPLFSQSVTSRPACCTEMKFRVCSRTSSTRPTWLRLLSVSPSCMMVMFL